MAKEYNIQYSLRKKKKKEQLKGHEQATSTSYTISRYQT